MLERLKVTDQGIASRAVFRTLFQVFQGVVNLGRLLVFRVMIRSNVLKDNKGTDVETRN